MMEENGSDNIVFSLLYGISLIRVYGQNRREGYREEAIGTTEDGNERTRPRYLYDPAYLTGDFVSVYKHW